MINLVKYISILITVSTAIVGAILSEESTNEKRESSMPPPEHPHSEPKLIGVERIWDQAPHNAFTDLIEYNGRLFCCFREGDDHGGGIDGTIRILASDDGLAWSSVAHLKAKGFDLRDPKFSIMTDGRLMLTVGGSIFQGDEYLGCRPHVAFSKDGIHWSDFVDLQMPEEWIWRVTWHQGIGYGVSYRFSDHSDLDQPWIMTLFQTQDGIKYDAVTNLEVPDFPSEATLRFLPDGTMVALARRYGNGWIGTATAPYTTWSWTETRWRLGGPNFLILPNGNMWASSRLISEGLEPTTQTAIGPMTTTSYVPSLVLPSDGDTSYAGMVYRAGILYVSYYSSHEGKSCVYLARIQP